jgi:hypothetical protein
LDRRRLWSKTGTGRVSGKGSGGLEFGAVFACTGGIMKKIFVLAAYVGTPSAYRVTGDGSGAGFRAEGMAGLMTCRI